MNSGQLWRSVSRTLPRVARAALAFAITLVSAVDAVQAAHAQNLTVLYRFKDDAHGGFPLSGVVMDAKGNLYGTAIAGGNNSCDEGCGVAFKLDPAGKESVLHSFTGSDGEAPDANLLRDVEGNLYGVTEDGGSSGCGVGCGTVFKVDKLGKTTVLYEFTGGADGGTPSGNLIEDADGNLYGATFWGGNLSGCFTNGCGVLFKLDRFGSETALYTFSGKADGANPNGGLVRDAEGNFYGTAADGGDTSCYLGCGTAFKLDSNGGFTVLHSFTAGAGGSGPTAGLIRDVKGNLYGTTAGGGSFSTCPAGCGTVFKLDAAGRQTVLYRFKGGRDGVDPVPGLIRDAAGDLYGTTSGGGDLKCTDGVGSGCGVVFKLDAAGKETVLHRFKGMDGDSPAASLARDANGNLYGTTFFGGDLNCGPSRIGCGVVFKITP
jgi:uncharacterized repeat protein (TIGR03803 family)